MPLEVKTAIRFLLSSERLSRTVPYNSHVKISSGGGDVGVPDVFPGKPICGFQVYMPRARSVVEF